MIKKLALSAMMSLSLFCISFNAHALKASSTPLEGSQVGIAYKLIDSDKIYGTNVDTYFHPASTQKMVTALAAMLYLGSDFQLITKLEVRKNAISKQNKLIVDPNGTLHSDVIIRFVGDPTLRVDHYRTLIGLLKKHGVHKIDGDFILDVSRFTGQSRGSGWSWDDLPVCFTAPSAPIILNRNCTFAQLKAEGVGTHAAPLIPKGVPIDIKSEVVAVKESDYGGDCILEANLFIDNNYHLVGCIPDSKDHKPWPLSLAIADAEKWGRDWTESILKGHGIRLTGTIKTAHEKQVDTVAIGQRASPHLDEMVKYMLQKSNNLYADSLAKNIAAEYFDLPATYYRANRAIRSILLKYAKIDLGSSYIVDGSGLSPHNLMSPHTMLKILDYINKHNDKLGIIELMPVSAQSGTLQWRASTFNPPLKQKVIAKTGSLQNVSNLAGFVITQSGARVPFVLFTNSITYPESTRERVKYHRQPSPHYAYERYIIENIYKEKRMGIDFK